MPSPNMDQRTQNPTDVFHDLFICMIDFEPLKEPKLLQCGHSFCKECLLQLQASLRRSSRDLLSEDDTVEKLKCPVCSRFTVLTDDGVDGLSDNFMLEKLRDCVKELKKEGKVKDVESAIPSEIDTLARICEMSSTCKANKTQAQFRCHECAKNCCMDCHEKHEKFFSLHKTVSFSSDLANLMECPDHTGEYIKFYCLDCKVSLCTMCCVDSHCSDHSIVEIMDKENIIQERHYIGEHLNQVKETLNHVKVDSNKLSDLRMCLYDMYAKCEEEMQFAFKRIIQAVKDQFDQYEMERQHSKMATEKMLDVAQEEINYHMSNCTSLIHFVERILSNEVSYQPLTLFRDLSARMTLAVKDIPALNVIIPEVHVAHLVPEEPSTLIFGHMVDSVLQPKYTAGEVELTHITDKRDSRGEGYFMPEAEEPVLKTQAPEVSVQVNEPPKPPPRKSRDKVGKSKFYSDAGGIFVEEHDPSFSERDSTLPSYPTSILRRPPASERILSESDEVFPESPSYFTSARGSYAYTSDPLDMLSFRRCVSSLSLSTPKQRADFMQQSNLPPAKKSLFGKLVGKFSTPKAKKEKHKGEKTKDTKKESKKEQKVKRPVHYSNIPPSTPTVVLHVPSQETPQPPAAKTTKAEGTRMWHISCSSSGPGAPITYPSDVAISPTSAEVYIVDHMQARIAVLQAGALKRIIKPMTLPKFSPWGVAVSVKGYLYVTDLDNHCIHVFGLQGDHITSWASPEDHVPYGVTTSHDGALIVVTSASQQSPPSNILVNTYKQDGTVVHSFRCTYGGAHGELKDPRYVLLDTDSSILVTDGDTGQVQRYTLSGNLLGNFSRKLGRPAGLCLGPDEDILVADRGANNRVARFSKGGQFQGDLDTDCTVDITWAQSMDSCVVGGPSKIVLLAVTEYLVNSKVTVGLYAFPHKEGKLNVEGHHFL